VATGSADETARIWDAEIGQPLADPFRYSGPVQHVEFTPDGSRLLVVPATGDVQLIDVLQVRLPAPSWLPALAEAVARQHLNERQMTEPVPAEQFFRLKEELNSLPDSPLSVHWAKWFMADPAQRTISPNSTIGLRAYRDGLLRAGTKAALRRAIRLDPTDALAHARLAQLLISPEQTAPPPRDISEARWHERYARKLQPESRDISRLCDIVESRISALNLPTASPPESR
jgi:WD40 repeat protein